MSLEIEKWEIWHTYATFLDITCADLDVSARRLVTSGIAECAVLSDGKAYWGSNGKLGSGSTTIKVGDFGARSTVSLKLDDGCTAKPEGFAFEAWGQAASFIISEQQALGGDVALPPPHLRAYLGKCVLASDADRGTGVALAARV